MSQNSGGYAGAHISYANDADSDVAPAQNRTGVHVSILWNFAVNERTPASYLPSAARSLLSQAVINACDALDGVKDGVITDPEKCHFDPASLQCKSDGQQNCLTASQVGTHRGGYFSFQPLWDWIVAKEPDLLD